MYRFSVQIFIYKPLVKTCVSIVFVWNDVAKIKELPLTDLLHCQLVTAKVIVFILPTWHWGGWHTVAKKRGPGLLNPSQ